MNDLPSHSAPLAPLIAEARERGRLLFLPFRRISFTPDELEGTLAQGKIPEVFRQVTSYRLIPPAKERERLCHDLDAAQDEADRLVKVAEQKVLDHDRRMRDWRASAKD